MTSAYRHTTKWLAIAPIALMLAFVLVPVLNIFSTSLRLDSFAILSATTTRNIVWFTTWQAFISTAIVLVIASPIAAVIANFKFIGRRALISLVSVPFILPTVVVGAAFLELLPRSIHRSALAIIIAHVYFNVGLAVRIISSRWQQIHPQLDDAARTLGASTIRTFLTITLPLLKRSFISAGLLVFLMCFTSYGVVRILGGPARSTIETEIYFRAMQLGDVSGALVLSILQLVVVGILIFLITNIGKAKASPKFGQTVYSRMHHPRSSRQKLLVATVAITTAVAVVTPLMSVLHRSIYLGQRFDTSAWRSVLVDTEIFSSLLTSLRYAIFSIVVSSIVGLLGASAIVYGSSRYQFVNLITSIPIVLSAVTLGLGLIITFDVNPIDWRGSWLMMPIAHCLVAIPIVIRIISPVLRDLPNDLRDASRTLGATTWQMWRTIDLRIITPALITAAAIACAISLGEFGASSFLVRRNNETLPLTISRLLSRPGDNIQAQAYAISTLLIVVCIGIIALVDYRDSNERGV